MIKCPMCRQQLPDATPRCHRCQTDLSLLADYVANLRDGLNQAEALTRAGELGEAVWAYLAVLEVDPDNTTARRQVGKVVTAVRQFDQTAPGRRWFRKLQKESRLRRWLFSRDDEPTPVWGWVALFLLFFASVVGAFYLGQQSGRTPAGEAPPEAPAAP